MKNMISSRVRDAAPWLGAAATGLLLFAAFPPLEWKDLSWIAFVPLLLVARRAKARQAFRLGLVSGAVFWLSSIAWLTRVTVVGWLTLSLYCALFVAPAAVLFSAWTRRRGTGSGAANVALMVLLTAVWAGFEYLRSTLFTGFAWNPLGATQARNVVLLRLAQWGGVYAVSALVMWVNAALALTLLRYAEGRAGWARRAHPEVMLAFLALVAATVFGARDLRRDQVPTSPLRVTVIQPNIPQDEKWTPEKYEMIYSRLRTLTEQALRAGTPALVVWPETAVPDDIRSSEQSYGLVYEMATNGAPILVGSMDTEWIEDAPPRYYNSSFLFDGEGLLAQVYDKRHLVLFGEYVPLQPFLPFVKALTPIQESFSPGRTSTVFRLEASGAAFSALICFEDTVAPLAAESVRNGARLLINQTNDAWFDPGWASRQHMIQSILRCVENGVPAVRSANTGVSCFIDRYGRVTDILDDGHGVVRIAGWRAAEVQLPPDDMPLTFYTRHGDLFAQACAGIGFLALFFACRRRPDATNKGPKNGNAEQKLA